MFEYTFRGQGFTQQEIKEKAGKIGLSIDEYLSKYPEVKKVNKLLT